MRGRIAKLGVLPTHCLTFNNIDQLHNHQLFEINIYFSHLILSGKRLRMRRFKSHESFKRNL